jgi:Helix-turn-helix domain
MRSKTQFRDSGKNQRKLRFRLSPRRAAAFAETQRGKILALLIATSGGWVPLPQILSLSIAQYAARILELRRMGYTIENRTDRVDGVRHSWFRLANSPTPTPEPPKPQPERKERARATGLPLFDLAVRR